MIDFSSPVVSGKAGAVAHGKGINYQGEVYPWDKPTWPVSHNRNALWRLFSGLRVWSLMNVDDWEDASNW